MKTNSEKENPDKIVAKEASGVFKKSIKLSVASAGVAIVFFFRSSFGCEPKAPEGIDFEWYGNHCGPGYGDPDDPAIDELDEACKRHDKAYKDRLKK